MIYELIGPGNSTLGACSLNDREKLDSVFFELNSKDPSISANEWFEIFTDSGKKTGQIKLRDLIHREGDWHRSMHYHEYGIQNDEPYLLFQKRGKAVDARFGVLDAVAAGHYKLGEGETAAIREIEEELGKELKLTDLSSMGVRRFIDDYDQIKNREFQDVYFMRNDNANLNDYKLGFPEVAAIYKIPIDDLIQMLSGKMRFIENVQIAHTDGEQMELARAHVFCSDFWPNTDQYFYRTAIIAKKILEGKTIPDNPYLLDADKLFSL